MSPGLIHFSWTMHLCIQREMIAGAMKYSPAILHIRSQVMPEASAAGDITAYAASGPTSPAVPIPDGYVFR